MSQPPPGGAGPPGRDRSREAPADDDVADLHTWLAEPEQVESVLDGTEPGPVAVVSDPYAGRERVLAGLAERLDATRLCLDPGDDPTRITTTLDGNGPVVIEDCQHLYRRVVGGFDPLETVLDRIASSDATVLTGWNRYAWTYLAAVRSVDAVFPVVAEVGPVETDRLAELVLEQYEEVPAFELDSETSSGAISLSSRTVAVRGRTLSVPVPSIDLAALRAGPDGTDVEPADLVFERLAATAEGNVGVAAAIWERRRGDVVRPSDLATPGSDLDLDREEAFCLRILLAKERVRWAELEALFDNPQRVLVRLRRSEVVSADDEAVWLSPAAVPTAAAHVERERIQ